MKNKNEDEQEIIAQIQNVFDVVPEHPDLDEEMRRFLNMRVDLERSEAAWFMKSYLKHYQELKKFGLEEKLMGNIEFSTCQSAVFFWILFWLIHVESLQNKRIN